MPAAEEEAAVTSRLLQELGELPLTAEVAEAVGPQPPEEERQVLPPLLVAAALVGVEGRPGV